jgi:hypothetical protein
MPFLALFFASTMRGINARFSRHFAVRHGAFLQICGANARPRPKFFPNDGLSLNFFGAICQNSEPDHPPALAASSSILKIVALETQNARVWPPPFARARNLAVALRGRAV